MATVRCFSKTGSTVVVSELLSPPPQSVRYHTWVYPADNDGTAACHAEPIASTATLHNKLKHRRVQLWLHQGLVLHKELVLKEKELPLKFCHTTALGYICITCINHDINSIIVIILLISTSLQI